MEEKGLIPQEVTSAISPTASPNILINQGEGLQIMENHGAININANDQTLTKLLQSMFGTAPAGVPVTHTLEWASLCRTHYCLFLLVYEEFKDGVFSIAKDRALLKYTPQDIRSRYKNICPETIEELRQMPCIFAKRNMYYKRTEEHHPFLAGRICDIVPQGESIKIYFCAFQAIPQQLLNQNIQSLRMASSALRNELDEEHWSIKECDLPGVFASLDIEIK